MDRQIEKYLFYYYSYDPSDLSAEALEGPGP